MKKITVAAALIFAGSSLVSCGEPTRTLYEQSKSAINRRFCYNMEKDSVKLIVKAHE